ncbi:MAG: M3 family metallopeptidase [Bdellovibrionota bacterium]
MEAPSQMMESWVWQPQTIKMMSKHYKTGESLPDEVLKKMIELKQLGQALGYTSQVIYAQMDLDFHSNPEAAKDTQKHIQKLYADLVGLELEDNMYRQASFGHLAGVNTDTDGYDSAYYGYLWSEVYAKDMFTKFEEKGILNPKVGMAYRKEILAPGSSRSVDVSLKKFLGRKPSDQAFFDELGLKPLK